MRRVACDFDLELQVNKPVVNDVSTSLAKTQLDQRLCQVMSCQSLLAESEIWMDQRLCQVMSCQSLLAESEIWTSACAQPSLAETQKTIQKVGPALVSRQSGGSKKMKMIKKINVEKKVGK